MTGTAQEVRQPAADRIAVDNSAEHRAEARRAFFRVFPCVALSFFLGQIDQSIVATALPTIARELNSLSNISWVVISYLLAQTVTVPIWGRLSDLYGRRRMLLTALSIMVVSSIGCALAPGLGFLILARVVQGLGGGGLHTLSASIMGEVIRPRERARFQGYFSAIFVAANAAGPVIGGVLAAQWGWRSVFWVQLPVGLLAIVLASRLPKLGRAVGKGVGFDYLGAGLFIAAATTLLLGLTELSHGQNSPFGLIAGLAAFGLVAGTLFVRWEMRAPHSFLDLKVIGDPTIWRVTVVAACLAASLIGTIVFVPLFLQTMHGWGSAESGAVLMPLSFGGVAAAAITGQLISRTGRTTIYSLFGLPLPMIALFGMAATAGMDLPHWVPYCFALLFGLGSGTVNTTCMFLAQVSVGTTALGAATSTVNFGRAIGSTLGAAIVSTTLLASLSLIDPEASGMMTRVVEEGPHVLESLSRGVRSLMLGEFGLAFSISFLTLVGFPIVAWLVMWRVPLKRLSS